MKIEFDLHRHFEDTIAELTNYYGKKFTVLNGLSEDQLNHTSFIDGFVDKKTVSDASIDGNANVGTKDICSLKSEKDKPNDKLLSFNKIFYELEKKYGLQAAKNWLRGEWNGEYYLHDSHSATYIPYCFAYDLEALATRGLFFIDNFNGGAPQHLTTFTDFVGEFVSWVSNRSSGRYTCRFVSFPRISGVNENWLTGKVVA